MLRRMLGHAGLEIFAIAGILGIIILITGSCPWYLARFYGLDAASVVKNKASHDDANLLLMLDAFITAVHLALPIRWIVLWPVEVAVVICYAVVAFSLGSPMPLDTVLMNVMMMLVLSSAAGLGRRTIEFHERVGFNRIAAEKTLRFQLEHKLEKFTMPQAGPRRTDDAASIPTTTHTGEIFGDLDGLPSEERAERLKQITELGYAEHWLIPEAALHTGPDEVIGRGGFGLVVAATYHGAPVALKVPINPLGTARADSCISSMVYELRIFRRLRHPNVVLFYGACLTEEPVLVMERVRGTPLDQFVQPVPAGPAAADRMKLARDTCCALMYLHAQRPIIVHGDLKGSNVLVEQLAGSVNAKLIDFGLSRLITRSTKPLGGTLRWMAPEVIRSCGKPAPSSDVFSFGRLLFMIMVGRKPLAEVAEGDVVRVAHENRCLELVWPPGVHAVEECRRITDACTRTEPSARPTTLELHLRLQMEEARETCAVKDTIALARGSSIGRPGPQDPASTDPELSQSPSASPIRWGDVGLVGYSSSTLTQEVPSLVEEPVAEVVGAPAPQSSSSSSDRKAGNPGDPADPKTRLNRL